MVNTNGTGESAETNHIAVKTVQKVKNDDKNSEIKINNDNSFSSNKGILKENTDEKQEETKFDSQHVAWDRHCKLPP